MKKKMQQQLMVIFIILVFGFSSVAYIVNSVLTETGNEPSKPVLKNYVLDYEINKSIEDYYRKLGYSFLRYYYTIPDKDIYDYLGALPEAMKTTGNEVQLYVMRVNSNETYIQIDGYSDNIQINNITRGNIFTGLCNVLMSMPIECLLANRTD